MSEWKKPKVQFQVLIKIHVLLLHLQVNKDEAEKCLHLGADALKRGDTVRARKFLSKSIKLYPLPAAEALLAQAERGPSSEGPNGSFSSSRQQPSNGVNRENTFGRTESTSSATTGLDGREYTEEQARIVKQLLQAREGGRGAHYRVLGLEQNCTENDIKKAYRKISLKVHPDKNSAPQADEAFKAVGLAYATLSDKQKRDVYDRYGDEDPDNVGGVRSRGRRGGGVHMNGQEVSPEEIFNMFFGGGMAGGGMGPGFHMSSGFGGPGVHFQAGVPRRRTRPGPAGQPQQQQAARAEGAALQMLFQLLPVIMIFMLSFLRMGEQATSGQNQYFSLTVSSTTAPQ